ncbi:MAG: 2-C-methyl-D-erythritol 4-phosphate cytidylyltransferase [Lachnospiraceae bacterium]|nr:2-C-methyl-D-erythritol 4-phosphate cytidylyltransferase [Lachnospiraceae bacterium]
MGTGAPKQFLPLCGEPVLTWTLRAFEESSVQQLVLVVSSEEAEEFCRHEIIGKHGFQKVRTFVRGGAERYDSVWNGLRALSDVLDPDAGYVLIHDGARCLVTPEIIHRTLADAKRCGAAVASVPVKDTIKRVDAEGFSAETLERKTLRQMQTPQTFSYSLIKEAYRLMIEEHPQPDVTDDAEVLQRMCNRSTFLSEGNYENLKITTPEDLLLAETILKSRGY